MSLKSKTFEKLSTAVDSADETTVDGVEILALAASAVKNLNEGTDIEDDVYQIGVPGELGFGVATCPDDLIPGGWRGLDGHNSKISPNYGNYIDANGSVLVYIPKHYYRWDGNNCYISSRPLSGYVIDRSFINAGKEINGVFIYKYGAGNVNGIFGSRKGIDPVSTHVDHNPIGNLNGSPINNYGGLYTAVKTAGSDYYLTSIFNYSMLARLAFSHGKAATSNVSCAYRDVLPLMPKGNLVNALKDANDGSVTFTPSGYLGCALTGSGTPFAKTTHNGQDCGIADLNGNMHEVASGFTCLTSSGADSAVLSPDDFLILKESIDISAILDDSTTAGTGAYDASIYDQISLAGVVDGNDGWTYLGNGTEPVFGMSTDRATDIYKKTSIGMPTDTGVSATGTIEFGSDGLYRYLRNEMACLVGGDWGYSSAAGLFMAILNSHRARSSCLVGGRASFLV